MYFFIIINEQKLTGKQLHAKRSDICLLEQLEILSEPQKVWPLCPSVNVQPLTKLQDSYVYFPFVFLLLLLYTHGGKIIPRKTAISKNCCWEEVKILLKGEG